MINAFRKIFKDHKTYLSTLEHFSICQNKGFLAYYTDDISVSKNFKSYENLYENIHQVLNSQKINEEINNLKYEENDLNSLKNVKEYSKIFSITTAMTNSFLYFNSQEEYIKLPRQLSVPLYYTAQKLNIIPVFCLYTSVHSVKSLGNKPDLLNFNDVKMRFSFTGTITEDYFLKINFMCSVRMKNLLDIIFSLNNLLYKYLDESTYEINLREMSPGEKEEIKKGLKDFAEIIDYSNKVSLELFEYLNPDDFYHKVRPFLYGYSQYKNGVYFEGIDKTFNFSGASAGQDPYNMLIKAVLGISYSHSGDPFNLEYEDALKRHVRKNHLNFVQIIEKFSIIKKLEKIEEFAEDYKNVGAKFRKFYQIHNGFVTNFIEKPSEKSGAVVTGAGGTGLRFLKTLSKEYYKKNIVTFNFDDFGKNSIVIDLNKTLNFANVRINLDENSQMNLSNLSKFNIENKIHEILVKEGMFSKYTSANSNIRFLINFMIKDEKENTFSKSMIKGLKSIIDDISSKNVNTNFDVFTITYDQQTSQLILDHITEFLLTPNISTIMHSTFLELRKTPQENEVKNFKNNSSDNKSNIDLDREKHGYVIVTGKTSEQLLNEQLEEEIEQSTSKILAHEGNNILFTYINSDNPQFNKHRNNLNILEKDYNISCKLCELNLEDPESIRKFAKKIKEENIYIKGIVNTLPYNLSNGNAIIKEENGKNVVSNLKTENSGYSSLNPFIKGNIILQEELERSGMLLNSCRAILLDSLYGRASSKFMYSNNKNIQSIATVFSGDMKITETISSKNKIVKAEDIGKIISFFLRKEISNFCNGAKLQANMGKNLTLNVNNIQGKSGQVSVEKSHKNISDIQTDSLTNNKKILTLPEATMLCALDPFDPISNPKGKINFGASQNYLLSKHVLKYLPSFLKDDDLHYSQLIGIKDFREILSQVTGYNSEETLTIHSVEGAIDLVCHQFKNVYIKNNSPNFNLEGILNHSMVNVTDEKNSEFNIIIHPSDEEIGEILNNLNKLTLIVITEKRQIKYPLNLESKKFLIYAYTAQILDTPSAVMHSHSSLINEFDSHGLSFYVTSNIIQAAAIQRVEKLSADHEIKISLQKMFKSMERLNIPSDKIFITNRSTKALDSVAKTLFKKNDLIGITTPLYPAFPADLTRSGANMLYISSDREHEYVSRGQNLNIRSSDHSDMLTNDSSKLLEKILEAKEKGAAGFVICNPENPTGRIYEKSEVDTVCKWAQREENKDFFLIFDELYANSCHSIEKTFHSSIEYSLNYENILTLRGFAKDFGVSGFNLGLVISCNKKIKSNFDLWEKIIKPHDVTLAVYDQMLKKSDYGLDILKINTEYIKNAMSLATKQLDKIGVKYICPHGGLFICIDLEDHMKKFNIESENEVFEKLIYEYGLNISPGSLFKFEKKGLFRLCLVYDDETILEGITRLERFLNI